MCAPLVYNNVEYFTPLNCSSLVLSDMVWSDQIFSLCDGKIPGLRDCPSLVVIKWPNVHKAVTQNQSLWNLGITSSWFLIGLQVMLFYILN